MPLAEDYRRDEFAKTKLVDRLREADYYKINLSKELLSLGVLPSLIYKADVNPYSTTSPMARSELYTIDLFAKNGVVKHLFLQVYTSGSNTSRELAAPISAEQAVTAKQKSDELEYRLKHMEMWNSCALPAPTVLHIANVTSDDYPSLGSDFAMGLITTRLDGDSTHDLDLLALKFRKNGIEDHLKFDRLTSYERSKYEKERNVILQVRDEIINSMLSTRNKFAVVGTCAILKPNNQELYKLTVDRRRLLDHDISTLSDFRLGKLSDYFTSAYSWHCGIKRNENITLRKALKMFRKAVLPILKPSLNEERFVYSQGDEFPHHFKHQLHAAYDTEELVSYLLDADHACIDRLERSSAKILLPHYQDLSYDEMCKFVISGNKDLEAILSYDKDNVLSRRLNYLKDESLALLEFDLVAIDEAICLIGRAAKDESKGNKEYTNRRVDDFALYNNIYMTKRFRDLLGDSKYELPKAVDMGVNKPRRKIKTITASVSERISKMLKGDTPYGKPQQEVLDSLKVLQDELLSQFDIPENGNDH